ncbi:helix-turn-helix domain-containing protein [Myroides pelagicus]|uniref:Helix-turn-helix domain-containing protein n=1 Tax=Myroides pelagicus TaxID=270914 RepID=A0A7K1GPD3_9FLAO|nr:AraC family transcriptional regulator [Myroides pelagicus]MTH30765.1 helix-turn-helix domain-containing protein [Myroides pelagicus]
MILLFLIVLSFISFVLLYNYNTTKTQFSRYAMYMASLFVVSSFVVFISKYKALFYIPVGLILSFLIGSCVFLFLKDKAKMFYRSLLINGIIFSTVVIVYFGLRYFSAINLIHYHWLVNIGVVVSCLFYASLGYINYMKRSNQVQDNFLIAYIVMLLSYACISGITFLSNKNTLFDQDYVFMFFSLAVVLLSLMHEYIIVRNSQEKVVDTGGGLAFSAMGDVESKALDESYLTIINEKRVAEVVVVEELQENERMEISQLLYERIIKTKVFLQEDLSLNHLASIVQVNEKRLRKYFKQSDASSYKAYINRLKIEYAVNLVSERNKQITVEELSVLAGFSTRLAFYRAFVQVHGFPPSKLLHE